MEKKKKKDNNNNKKLAPSLISQETETNESMSKEDQNQTGMGLARKKQEAVCSSSPNDNNGTSTAQNYPPPILQWPYTPQPILKQTQIIPTTSVSNQQKTPIVPLNQWQTSLFTPQGPQQQQPPVPQQHQSNGAFWLPPGPGYPVARAPGAASAAYQPFVPMGTTEAISRNETSIPSFSYQGGYPHPMGFPGGPWDPSSWWGQAQQSQPSPYTFAGPYGYFSLAPPPAQDSTVAYGQPHQRGIIQPQAKLSQKHQKMWETQSSENVQLWAAISQLQAEMSTYGSRVLKLEAEVSSLKSKVEENSGAGASAGNALTGQIKRGRPKKVASTDVLPCLDESQPRARARKNVVPKVQSETKILHTEKEIQDMDKYKACQEALGTATTKQEYNEKISNLFTISCSGFELNESKLKMPLDVQATSTFPTHVNRDIPGIQHRGFGFDRTTVTKDSDNKLRDQKSEFSVLPSEHVKGLNIVEITSTTYKETMNNRNHFWASNNLPDECGRNLLDVRSHAFNDNGKGIIQEEKVIPGWNFVNENASEVHADVAVGSGKDEDGEEM